MFSVQNKTNNWPTKKHTLHAGFRKRELERITKENYQILRRLQSKKSNYSAVKWEKERKVQEQMVRNISEYPIQKDQFSRRKHFSPLPQIRSPHISPKNDSNRSEVGYVNVIDNNSDLKPLNPPPLPRHKKKAEKLIPIDLSKSSIKIDPERKVIYRKVHKYDKKDYLIEISRTKIKYFIVAISLGKKQSTQILDFNLKKGKRLIKI